MKASGAFAVSALLATVGGLVACPAFEAPGPASVMSPALPFLSSEVDRALRSLREARGDLTAEGSHAQEALDEAEAALVRLQTYYVPLLEARQRAFNARQLAASGELGTAEGELGHIETTLLTLARSGGEEMGRQVAEPLDLLEEARVALARSSPEAPARLEDLAERLELMLLKGDLVLD
jgi:chromosome segregation ATPase